MSYNIYLLEDENNLNQLLSSYLENEGWKVKSFLRGLEAKKVISENPHLWILDIMLPDIDGYQLIADIKEKYPTTPVIFISARDADLDRITGLEKGSDDYLAKPFSPRELVIRTRKLLERFYGKTVNFTINYSKYNIDIKKRSILDEQECREILLTSKEFDLLEYFINNLQQALSRQQILHNIWENDYFGTERVVDDLIRRLRKKLPGLKIETLYGYGYKLVDK
ncbi:MAG: response regulator transcription factor [Firmicutes bacterium]|nr:response regulator transcription factor [Bacillota bacterium]